MSGRFTELALAFLISAATACAADEEIAALSDSFADGNIHTGPAWVAGDLNWYNPFFAENLDGKWYATARRYGSMGTWFALPPERVWPVALDPELGPLRLALTVRFRPGVKNNFISMSVLGPQSDGRWGARFNPDGGIAVRVAPMSDKGGVHIHCPVPQMQDGKPVRFEFVLGGAVVFELLRDGKTVFVLEPEKREAFRKELRRYERLAFLGSTAVADDNPYVMSPTGADAQGDFWISDIDVRGVPERVAAPEGLTLDAPPRSMLALRGPAGLDTTLFADLTSAGWTVTQEFDQTTGSAQPSLQKLLLPETLRRYQCVVLADIAAPRLGLRGCVVLKAYVAAGGNLFIFGGASTLSRGRYFSSPLAACLPVKGNDQMEAMKRTTAFAGCDYAYQVTPTNGAKATDGTSPFIVEAFGKGRTAVCPWATLGTPAEPFWRSSAFTAAVLGVVSGSEPARKETAVTLEPRQSR